MFSMSQFDSSSAFSGGGFTPSQPSHLGDSTPSPAKSRDAQGLIPLTVKQISEISHSGDEKSNFQINGLDVTNVSVVGMVFDKAERVTDVGFVLDDGTGRIGCRRWSNDIIDTKEIEAIQDGTYVRVNGTLKSLQDTRQLVAFSVRPVTNFDEITFHFVECVHFHLQNSKVLGGALSQPQVVDPSLNTPVRSKSSGSQAALSNQFSAQFNVDGLKSYDQSILSYLQQHSNDERIKEEIRERGVHRDELSQQLKIPLQKILDSIKNLEDEGLIYSTIDDFHFKIATLG
ncbi:tRNA_anti domain-containing protein/RPA_C domain-containing protein [Cephalotus follicularis]|uniref:tRNA_anti domain-containing protein/RPA_C domain-containing protein n=1 Tax=Cephalotus follicularis TaxID=3775 RepID=A0A1Q3CCC3_CEPFO|nr:tRNA_anti domain-containing protein/RPA_C domain-containing protein [Cephalotus follicularis]